MASLGQRLRDRIASQGPIRFDHWVEACLYDSEQGFYTRGVKIGLRGAFATAPTLHPAFAAAMKAEVTAVPLRPGDERIVLEAGAGDASLAAALHASGERMMLVDKAAGMRRHQKQRLPDVSVLSDPSLVGSITGVVILNEVLDAVPFRLLRWPDEVHVGVDADHRFVEVLAPITTEPPVPAPRRGHVYVVRDYPSALAPLLEPLRRGRVIVADYGGEAAQVHAAARDPVRTYVAGQRGGDPLRAPGSQDITSDVDFDAVRLALRGLGLVDVSYEPQAAWLRRHGCVLPPAGHRSDADWRLVRLLDDTLGFQVLVAERR